MMLSSLLCRLPLPALLGTAALALCSSPVRAQATLLVGGNSGTSDYTTPGTATISGTGNTASGNFEIDNADQTTSVFDLVTTYNSSTLTFLSGGHIGDLETHGSSIVNSTGDFTDSNIGDFFGSVSSYDSSIVNITGGESIYLEIHDHSTINLSGGNLVDNFIFRGIPGAQISTNSQTSLLDISGYDLTVTTPDSDGFQIVSGTLLHGSPFEVSGIFVPGTLEFNGVAAVAGGPASNPVPEASTIVSFSLLLALGLGCGLTAKKRHTIA